MFHEWVVILIGLAIALFAAAGHVAIAIYNYLPTIIKFYFAVGGGLLVPLSDEEMLYSWAIGLPDLPKSVPEEKPLTFIYKALSPISIMIRPIAVCLIAYYLIKNYLKPHSNDKIKGRLSFDDLIELALPTYPAIKPAVSDKLLSRHPYKGTWQYPLSVMDFVMKHGMLIYKAGTKSARNVQKSGHEFFILAPREKKKQIEDFQYLTLDTEQARKTLITELGVRFTKLSDIPPLERALLCCLFIIGKGKDDKKRGVKYLNYISAHYVTPKLDADENVIKAGHCDLPFLNDLEREVSQMPHFHFLTSRHAYVKTLFLAILSRDPECARSKGKLPATTFHWLKPHNPDLWRVCHAAGKDAPFVESLAAFQHYEHERNLRTAIDLPVIEGSVDDIRRFCHIYNITREHDLYDHDKKAARQLEEAIELLRGDAVETAPPNNPLANSMVLAAPSGKGGKGGKGGK